METIHLPLSSLARNEGQIPGVPTNPRSWRQDEIDLLARSLEETPELFDARPIIVYPYEGKHIIMGGNLRYTAALQMGAQTAPCVVLPAATTPDKLKEIIIKDNGSFGEWDTDALREGWDALPLKDWGVPQRNCVEPGSVPDSFFEDTSAESNKPQTITITIPTTYLDKIEGIEFLVKTTLESWAGCSIKRHQ